MPAHKKIIPPQNCGKCGKLFKDSNPHENLCKRCRHKLPKCDSCHAIMAPEYGYKRFARKVGKYRICAGCDYELRRNGVLRISDSQYLLPSGRVKIEKVPAEDKV